MKTQTSIIRKYVRKSRSPFVGDDSTILLLATLEDSCSLQLMFDRYIYLHRDEVGRWLGISLSNQLVAELNDDRGKYRTDLDMIQVLYRHRKEIAAFLEHFSEQFESIMGLSASVWLTAAEKYWFSILNDPQNK